MDWSSEHRGQELVSLEPISPEHRGHEAETRNKNEARKSTSRAHGTGNQEQIGRTREEGARSARTETQCLTSALSSSLLGTERAAPYKQEAMPRQATGASQ